MPTFHYTLDDEPQTTTEHVLTPKQILSNAKPDPIDPTTHYLVQMIGNKRESYQSEPDAEIHMHQKMVFISVFKGETPVS